MKTINILLIVVLSTLSSITQAAVVNINFSGIFSAFDPADDPLLIQGAQFSLSIQYDETTLVPANLRQDMTTTDGALFIANNSFIDESRVVQSDFSLTNLPNGGTLIFQTFPTFAFQDKITSQPSTIPELLNIGGSNLNGLLFQGLGGYFLEFGLEENSNVNFSPEDAEVDDMVMTTLPLKLIPIDATLQFSSFLQEIEPNIIISRDAGSIYEVVDTQFSAQYIPLPAAFWLFVSGMGLLGFIRRG